MKIQCNSCEIAEANVLCCADEAVLCWICDEKVHAANKLASKHQRVMLVNSGSQKVKCDICQESIGYIFCLEDRALLCRKCDVAIHTANTYVAQHQRFLITGVQVGLEPKEPVTSPPVEKSSLERLEGASSASVSKKVSPMVAPLLNKDPEMLSGEGGGGGNLPISQVSLSGSKVTGTSLEWSLDEFLSLPDFSQNYGFIESGSPKNPQGVVNCPRIAPRGAQNDSNAPITASLCERCERSTHKVQAITKQRRQGKHQYAKVFYTPFNNPLFLHSASWSTQNTFNDPLYFSFLLAGMKLILDCITFSGQVTISSI